MRQIAIGLAAAAAVFGVIPAQAQQSNMTFFVTSHGPGNGADLGGLAGADRHCQSLAQSVGAAATPGALISRRKATAR
jgi:hypothetical protein